MSYISFYSFLSENKTVIPDYQREYAQGRDHSRAKLIRESFVKDLYNSLVNNETTELDFVFGGTEGESGNAHFSLVDGQQRLTTLFLLHWYILVRAGGKPSDSVLNNFSYCTRDTTKTFCDHLKMITYNEDVPKDESDSLDSKTWCEDKISSFLKDMQWFKGSMESDPTVKSMLAVLDCIHNAFKNENNFPALMERLFCENAPIKFHCLNMEETLGGKDAVQDLYIKMNARGVPLTSFEIVKAQLQKKKENDRIDLLGEYLGNEDSLQLRTAAMGKVNTQYTNFFFSKVDSGDLRKHGFDRAMMNFTNELFRANFFLAAIKCKVNQKTYRNDNEPIQRFSGKEFNEFIETAGEKYYSEYVIDNDDKKRVMRSAFVSSIHDFFRLQDLLSGDNGQMFFEYDNQPCCVNFTKLIQDLSEDPFEKNSLTLSDMIQRSALFWFIREYGEKITEEVTKINFLEWSRFVRKMVEADDLKNFESVCETMSGLRKIILLLPAPNQLSEGSVLMTIGGIELTDNIDDNFNLQTARVKVSGCAKRQLEEERIKANLRTDEDWNNTILDAENYVQDGQLWFMLKCCEIDSQFDLERFKKTFEIYQILFDSDRGIQTSIGYSLLERALLDPGSKQDHLATMSTAATGTKIFLKDKFKNVIMHENAAKDAFEIVLSLMQYLINRIDTPTEANVITALTEKLRVEGPIEYNWKYVMKRFDLLDKTVNGLGFKNGFEPDKPDGGLSFTAIYTNSNRRTDSGELFSFALALELCKAGKKVEYTTAPYYEPYYNGDGQPNRFFSIEEKKVWFDPVEKSIKIYGKLFSFEEAYLLLSGKPLSQQD